MLGVVMLNVIMLNVVTPNDVMLSVVASLKGLRGTKTISYKQPNNQECFSVDGLSNLV